MTLKSISGLAAAISIVIAASTGGCATTDSEEAAVTGEDGLSASRVEVLGEIEPGETKAVQYTRHSKYPTFSFKARAGDTVRFAVGTQVRDYGLGPILSILAPNFRTLTRYTSNQQNRAVGEIRVLKTATYYVAVSETFDKSGRFTIEFESVKAGPPDPPDPCEACSNSCVSCTAQKGCGWDPTYSMCRSGTVLGPGHGYSPSSSWEWGGNNCRDFAPPSDGTCAATNCMECSGLQGCGWLKKEGEAGRCVPGVKNGPTDESIHMSNYDDWDWTAGDCEWDHRRDLPPGPVCNGSIPPSTLYGPDTPQQPAAPDASTPNRDKGPFLDWTCDVTRVKNGVTEHSSGSLCSFAYDVDLGANDSYCIRGDHDGVTSCTISNCVSHGCCWNGCDR